MSEGILIGELTIDAVIKVDDAQAQRELEQAQQQLGKRMTLPPVEIDRTPLKAAVADIRTELDKLREQSVKTSREQAAAAKNLEAQYRATAAEATAGAAKIKEQQAQLTLTTKLSAQTDREAVKATRDAMRDRAEQIDKLRLDYARLHTALDSLTISEAEFNQRGDQIIQKLRQMGQQADFTTKELKQLADMEGRISREQNTLAGVLNPVGLSGNVAVGLRSSLPEILRGFQQITMLSPSLGAASNQVSMLSSVLSTAGVNSGLFAKASTGAGVGAAVLGNGAVVAGAALGGLTIAVGASITMINKAIDQYAQYEFGLAKISTLTDKTPSQLKNTGDQLLKMAGTYGLSIADMQGAMEEILGASVKGTEDMNAALQFASVSARAAVASSSDARAAADGLTSVLNAYKLTATDAQRASDLMFKTVALGKISFSELAGSIGMVLPQAHDLKIPIEEVFGAVANLTQGGIKGGAAIEYLRSMLTNIQKPSEQAKQLAHDLGIQFDAQALQAKGLTGVLDDVRTATKGNSSQMAILFGDTGALQAATALTSNGMRDFKDTLDGVTNGAGATDTAYGKMADTVQKQSDRVAEKWKGLWTKVGELFAPFKLHFMQDIEDMLNSVDKLLERFSMARRPQQAAANVADLEAQLQSQKEYLAGGQRIIATRPKDDQLRQLWETQRLPNTLKRIAELEQQITEAKKAQAQAQKELQQYQIEENLRNGVVAWPNTGGKGGSTNTYGEEAGKFGYAFIEGIVRNGDVRANAKLGAWCADVAAKIQDELGNKIKYSASAGQLRKNAVAAGYQQVNLNDLKSGDLVFYKGAGYGGVQQNGLQSGNHVETVAGVVNGKIKLIGTNITSDITTKELYDLQHAAAYRAPTSPFATGKPTSHPSPSSPLPTVQQIAQAQRLQAVLEQATKARDAHPGVAKFVQDVAKAQAALDKFSSASDSNAAALKALGNQTSKTGGAYVASATEIKKYGNDALLLVKALEMAEKSGSAEAQRAAQARVDAWIGEDKARKSVFDLEGKAYGVRKQNADKATQDEKTAAQHAQQAAQLEKQLNADLASANQGQARATLAQYEQLRQARLAGVKNDATAQLAIEKDMGLKILAAQKRLNEQQAAADIQAAKDKAAQQRTALTTQYGKGKEPADQLKMIGDTEKRLIDTANSTLKTANSKAYMDYQERLGAAQSKVTEEARKQTQAIQDLRAKYSTAVTDMRQKIEAGTATDKDAVDYVQRLNAISREADKAGLSTNKWLTEARKAAYALTPQILDAYAAGIEKTADQYNDVQDVASRAAAAQNKYTLSLKDALAGLSEGSAAWDDYIASLEQLYKSGNLSADTLDTLRRKVQDLKDAQVTAALVNQRDDTIGPNVLPSTSAYLDVTGSSEPVGSIVRPDVNEGRNDPLSKTPAEIAADQRAYDSLKESLGALDDETLNLMAHDPVFQQDQELINAVFAEQTRRIQAAKDALKEYSEAQKVAALVNQRDDTLGTPAAIGENTPNRDEAGYDALTMTPAEAAAAKAVYDELVVGLKELDDAQLIAQLSMARLTKDADLENKVLDIQAQRIKANKDALRDLPALNAQLALGKLERDHNDPSQKMNEAWYIGERERLETALENAQWEVQKIGLTDAALENAERLHQDRLKAITAQGTTDRAKIQADATQQAVQYAAAGQQAQLDGSRADLEWEHNQKLISEREYLDRKQAMDEAAARAEYQAVVDAHGDISTAATVLENRLTQIRREGTEARKALLQKELEGFGKLFSGVGTLFKSIGAETVGAIADGASQALQSLSQLPTAINDVRTAFSSFKKGPSLAGLGELAGAIGGVASIAGSVISAIFAIGDAIEASNGKLNKWKSNLRELATLEQQRMGSQFIGGTSGVNGWENPYYQQLSQDAAARNQLANSKWYQRLAWGIFGGGPKVLSDDLAKTKSEAAAIFNDFGQSLYSTIEDTLMTAIDQGDFSNVGTNIGKMLDKFVQKMVVQAIIAKSKLKDLAVKLAEDKAAGRDITGDIAAIRTEMNSVTASVEAIAPSLAGYGAGADIGSSGSSLFGNAPTPQLGVPRIEVSLPTDTFKPLFDLAVALPDLTNSIGRLESMLDKGLTLNATNIQISMPDSFLQANALFNSSVSIFAGAVPDFAVGSADLKTIPAEFRSVFAEILTYVRRGSGTSGPPPLGGNGGLA